MSPFARTLSGCALALVLLASLSSAKAITWNETEAQSALFYAYGAYCNGTSLEAWTCKWCVQRGQEGFVVTAQPYDKRTNTFAYVGYNPRNLSIVVSFRGTQDASLRNWIVDLYLPLKEVYNASNPTNETIEIHSGFIGAYRRLAPLVRAAVAEARQKLPTYRVLVTGHSLGAALAEICALDLVEHRFASDVTVINFGSPRVGNDGFSAYYSEHVPNTTRVVNNRDIVPSLPPKVFGFEHVATEVWEHRNKYIVCSGSEDPKCSDSVVSYSVEDHTHYMGYETCECKSADCS
eukprot:TRINITY_DN4530_c0_g1_i1.p1 TRINITY_DN4530_c0_g1~~TRINITY_DN4530_c0_g1_i1.p1  ORF type:complete len:306 (+),score=75.95 TRINITY_DN4530_c0_g1_i1:43-918(+)